MRIIDRFIDKANDVDRFPFRGYSGEVAAEEALLDAIEKAIRSALEKGNADNAAYRERVYKSAFAALERALNARDAISDDAAEKRRTNLRAKIIQIETEFVPAETATPDHEPIAAKAPPVEPPRDTPPKPPDDKDTPAGTALAAEKRDIEPDKPAPKKRPFATMFMIVLVLAATGTGVWWTMQSGILAPVAERDGSVPNPAPKLDSESFRPEKLPDNQESGNAIDRPHSWISVFNSANSTDVTIPVGTNAEFVDRDGERYLRVSTSGSAELLFDVGEGTLERIAGGKALFSILARAQEGETTQMSVACQLAALGNCDRKRFEVGATLGEFLFELELPGKSPGTAGTIAINPDVANSGRSLDIKDIRVAITQ